MGSCRARRGEYWGGMRAWWQEKEAIVLSRNYWCQYCGNERATVVDHIRPCGYGGTDSLSNLAASCWTCNGLAAGDFFCNFVHKREVILERRRSGATSRPFSEDNHCPGT
jgi:5-methylcytosine-specific restriction endonuclease McrA